VTDTEIRDSVFRALHRVAPEVDPSTVGADLDLREEAGLDSFDYLHFIIDLSETLGVELLEADYPRLSTVNGIVKYLAARLPPGEQGVEPDRSSA
jgi:acyl carrier protein